MPVKIRIETDPERPAVNQVYFTALPDGKEIELPVTSFVLEILPDRAMRATVDLLVFEVEGHRQIAEIVEANIRCFLCPCCEEKLVREEHRDLNGNEFVGWSCGCNG